jgi:hypothetical protein
MPTNTLIRSYQAGGQSVSGSNSMAFDGEAHAGPITVAFASPNLQVDIGFPYATLKAFFVKTSAATQLSIFTNAASTGAPDNTIVIPAGAGVYSWTYLDGGSVTALANPFTANVAKLFLTLATSGTCSVEIFALWDATPV